ncbi:MFS transporter permease [Weissella diestrammenae]|uniref:MFS transporter permease n=1 Tax=Weissella diestrammenae TaxID=1162633 RepID=A0A7G9T3P8_9LACO|nr:MFS transporter permease [Weissella diestrammenae]MCM0582705.1 MFS transporter permease [Weissella diestrammenae]QNN74723.1 MFS transporter permease [Weissella diestrammenae]
MYNYRTVFTSSAKRKQIYGDFYSPFWFNTRKVVVVVGAFAFSLLLIAIFHWFTVEMSSYALLLCTALIIGAYQMDKRLKLNNLPFEITIVYFLKYFWHYHVKREQLYQDERLNSNSKTYQII